jgi:prolyl oligopeptidase PreP (S9A serine peptidase family)
LKNECWELIGMSRQRLGSITASESATGTNAAIQQSYAQTEPLFVAHEYVLGQLYQAIIDASLYIESSKPTSTLSYITSEGESAFVQVNGNDLKLRDLKVFPTNRPEDTQMFNELRQLSQAVLQNGGTIYDVIELYSTKSMREMKKTFKELKDRVQAMQDQQMRQKQQEIEQTQQIAAAQMEQALSMKQQEMINQNYQNDLDRINKKELALIAAESKGATMPDVDNNGVPDVLEIGKLTNEQNKLSKEYSIKMADIQSKASQNLQKMQLEREKLQVARENMVNDLQIAKENSKNRAQKPAKK